MTAEAAIRTFSDAAAQAMKAGRLGEADHLLGQAIALAPADPALWLRKAAALRAMTRIDDALGAVDAALRLEPRHFMALLMRASLLDRAGRAREAGVAYGDALTQAPPDEVLDAATRKAVARAREVNQSYARDMHGFLAQRMSTIAGSDADRRRAGQFADTLMGRRKVYRQEPMGYCYPGQPAIEFWDRDEFPWLPAFEAYTGAIIAELKAWAEGSDEKLIPYLDHPDTMPLDQWAELNQSKRWSALHLLNFGRPVEENCELFPKTLEALSLLPQPHTVNRSPSAMFSVLEPHTRIPPHTGISNTRLVVHLPLIVPPDCRFRVGNETRAWKAGDAWVFDDTIEHEAWNDSDHRRIILICDIWSPRLSADERQFIAALMAAMDEFNGVTTPHEHDAL